MRYRCNFFLLLTLLLANVCLAQEPATEQAIAESNQIAEYYAAEELQRFAKLFEQIRQLYVDEISDAELLEMAIRGLLEQLDPHSEYLSSDEQAAIERGAEGTYTGVGLELSMEEGELTVITPLDGSPADRAGLQPDDVILSIQGRSTWGMTFNEALDAMAGNQGTELRLMISRGAGDPFQVSLERSKVSVASVHASTLAHDVGYIRIRQFQTDTGRELSEELTKLTEEHPYLIGLVLDLRNNPGGVLQAAVEVTDAFIDEGLIVSTQGRDQGSNSEFYASNGERIWDLPIVVVMNRGSASAAEIVAGALQDHKRALVLGDISFGKGSVQNVIPLDDNSAIKLTTARYFTPSGRSIQARGIYPDISVLQGEISYTEEDIVVGEESLQGHLGTEDGAESPQLLGFRQTLSDITDIQLAQAVAILKGNSTNHNR